MSKGTTLLGIVGLAVTWGAVPIILLASFVWESGPAVMTACGAFYGIGLTMVFVACGQRIARLKREKTGN